MPISIDEMAPAQRRLLAKLGGYIAPDIAICCELGELTPDELLTFFATGRAFCSGLNFTSLPVPSFHLVAASPRRPASALIPVVRTGAATDDR